MNNYPTYHETQLGNYDAPCVYCEGRAFRAGECPRLGNGRGCITAAERIFRRRQFKIRDRLIRREARRLEQMRRGNGASAAEQLAADEREARL